MTSENIDKENIRSGFRYLTTLEFDKIIEDWEGDLPEDHKWWQTYTPFGSFFLKRMSYHTIEVTEENYETFIPVLEDFFLTDKEYEIIVRNVAFIKKDTLHAYRETPIYKIYNMMKLWNVRLTFKELSRMEYKTFMKLYLYTLGERFIVPMRKEKEEKGDIYQ